MPESDSIDSAQPPDLSADQASRETAEVDPREPAANDRDSGPLLGPGVTQSIEVGQTLGRYQIQKVLGRGTMGCVYLAHDTQLHRDVALKVPRLENDSRGVLLQRLFREARSAATLSHPNICPIYDIDTHSSLHFIAMGYVAGKPLAAYIESGKTQPEREVAKVVRKIALALDEAHSRGIIHRDLKPANIMVDKRGEPIVMDFGLACSFEDQTQTRLTREGTVVGTPVYMSPEQVQGDQPVGPQSDVYSLGVVLYELLTGRCPFEGSMVGVISQILHKEPAPVTALRPQISAEMSQLCSRAMAKRPQDRFPSMKEFAKALTAFLNKTESTSTMAPPTAELPTQSNVLKVRSEQSPRVIASPPPTRRPTRTASVARKPARQTPAWLIAAGGGAAAVAVIALGVYTVSTLSGARTAAPALAQAAPSAASGNAEGVAGAGLTSASSVESSAAKEAPVDQRGPILRPDPHSSPSTPVAAPPSAATSLPQAPPAVTAPILIPGLTAPAVSAPAAGVERPASRDGKRGGKANDPPEMEDDPSEPPEFGGPFGGRNGPDELTNRLKKMSVQEQFRAADRNRDKKLDPGELPMHVIDRADKNRDRELDLGELRTAFDRLREKLYDPPSAEEMKKMPRRRQPPPKR